MGNCPEQLGTVKRVDWEHNKKQRWHGWKRVTKDGGKSELLGFFYFWITTIPHSLHQTSPDITVRERLTGLAAGSQQQHRAKRAGARQSAWPRSAGHEGKASQLEKHCCTKRTRKSWKTNPRCWQRWGSQENSCWRLRRQQPHQADFQKCQIPFPTELLPPDVHFLFQHSFHITLSFLTQQLPSWRTEMWDFARGWLWSLVLLLSCTEVKRNQDANKVRTIIAETAVTVSPNPLSRQS